MKRTLIALGVLLLALLLIPFVGGSLMPREHVASSTIVIPAGQDTVWHAVRQPGAVAAWWENVERVERLDDPDGREVWRYHMRSGPMDVAVERAIAPDLLVTRVIAEPGAAFGGTWTYQLAPAGGGTRVTVVEAGYINNRFFRFIAGTFLGLHGTMDGYLRDLARHFGADAAPEHLT